MVRKEITANSTEQTIRAAPVLSKITTRQSNPQSHLDNYPVRLIESLDGSAAIVGDNTRGVPVKRETGNAEIDAQVGAKPHHFTNQQLLSLHSDDDVQLLAAVVQTFPSFS